MNLPHYGTHTHTQLLVVFVFISMLILGYTAEVKQADTYEDAVSAVWGPTMRIFVELCIFFYCFGASIAYLAVIGDQLEDSMCNLIGHFWSHDKS